MSRVFYDWEFLEDGRTIDWISVGMVDENGRELYLVNADLGYRSSSIYQRVSRHSWLLRNVVPHLPVIGPVTSAGFVLNLEDPAVVPTWRASQVIEQFIRDSTGDFAGQSQPELWAWYGAYDHVRLAQMWGPMIDKPEVVPMVTHDIMTLRLLAGQQARDTQPSQEGGEHHALADARHNRRLFKHYMSALLSQMDRKMDQEESR